jgi:hypothetical protein
MSVNELNKISKKYDTKLSPSGTKTIRFCGKILQRFEREIEGKFIEQVSNFSYLRYLISSDGKSINIKLQRYNKMNRNIKCHFWKNMTGDTNLRIHNISSKVALCSGREKWNIYKRDAQTLEGAKMRFLRLLLGLKLFDCQKNLTFLTG